jgi:hypothetical protein
MKMIFGFFVLTLTAIVSFAQTAAFEGPSISNGTVGKEFISCNGKTKQGVEAVVKVQVIPRSGIVLKYQLQGKLVSENVVTPKSTQFGSGYAGSPLSVVIPNIQGPAIDTYQLIVYNGSATIAVIDCRKNR